MDPPTLQVATGASGALRVLLHKVLYIEFGIVWILGLPALQLSGGFWTAVQEYVRVNKGISILFKYTQICGGVDWVKIGRWIELVWFKSKVLLKHRYHFYSSLIGSLITGDVVVALLLNILFLLRNTTNNTTTPRRQQAVPWHPVLCCGYDVNKMRRSNYLATAKNANSTFSPDLALVSIKATLYSRANRSPSSRFTCLSFPCPQSALLPANMNQMRTRFLLII